MNDIKYTGKFDIFQNERDGDHTIAIRVPDPNDVMIHYRDGVHFITGPIADKLYAYEELGYSPEELKKIILRYRLDKARDLALNSVYGTLGENSKDILKRYLNRMYGVRPVPISKELKDQLLMPRSLVDEIIGDVQKKATMEAYIRSDVNATNAAYMEWAKRNAEKPALGIKKVLFNDPATIVFWMDGSKTVVKATNEAYDPEKGLAMAISKRALGDKGNYYEVFKKHLKEDQK